MSLNDPRAVNDNHHLGELNYDDLVLQAPIPIIDEFGEFSIDGFSTYAINHRNKSLKHLKS